MNVDNDTGSLHQAANSLMVLQGLFGIIPHVFGKGEAARVRCSVNTNVLTNITVFTITICC